MRSYVSPPLCRYEADVQFKRDRTVDVQILALLGHRWEECLINRLKSPFDKVPAYDADDPCKGLKVMHALRNTQPG